MAALSNDPPLWGEIKPMKIPPVRRGTSKRRAKGRGIHMAQFWAMDEAERQITYAFSKAGRRSEGSSVTYK